MKLCIDPGHGGVQPGAVGRYSREKDLTLVISRQLRDKLSTTGIQIIMTREDDSDVSLQQRCNIANQTSCNFFMSIHCNSFSNTSVTGTETFYNSGYNNGYALATVVNTAAVSINQNNNRGVKPADYYVLSYTTMPSILLECAFISNPNEEDMMNNPDWQDRFTDALATAIAQYLGYSYTPPQPDNPDEIPDSIPGVKEIVKCPVGYDEYLIEDKRRILHLNKRNYISLDPDGIRIFVNGEVAVQYIEK